MVQLLFEQVIACGVDGETAALILPQINQALAALSPMECWQQFSQTLLKPDHPFALHHLLYRTAFADWDWHCGAPPAWFPSEAQIQQTHLAALMRQMKVASYPEFHAWSVQHRAEFWDVMIRRLQIHFQEQYTQVLDLSEGVEYPRWLVNARFNIAESCFRALNSASDSALDRALDSASDRALDNAPAIVFQPEGGNLSTWSYGELHALTNRVANGLVNAGFQLGDAIAIAMPMTPESVAIYLGIIKAGCVVVSIADSFAANEIATRLRITHAKAIFTQDWIQRGGKQLPLYDKVVAADAPTAIVLSYNPCLAGALRPGDLSWNAFLSDDDQFDAVAADPETPINILFSSGTTGDPKAIPWTQTTPIKCASDAHLHHDIHPGTVVAWSTNLGWMMGPWLIFASLINRGTIALYSGAPTMREYGQFIQAARVNVLGVVPSLVSSWKASRCMQGLDWSAIQAFSSTGECSNPQDMLFLMSLAGYKPIIEYCGGTEIGGAYITGTLVQPAAPATFTTAALGLDFVILDSEGYPGNTGEAFIVPPSIGLSTELLNRDHHQVYFADTPPHPILLRRHGDRIEKLPNGYYRAHGRVDDTMNLGGIKVSTIEIESVLANVNGICETAAIAISPVEGGPSQLIVYAVVTPEVQAVEPLKQSLQNAIGQQLNPLFKIHDVVIVETLPRTASNKVMRRVLRDQYKQDKVYSPYLRQMQV